MTRSRRTVKQRILNGLVGCVTALGVMYVLPLAWNLVIGANRGWGVSTVPCNWYAECAATDSRGRAYVGSWKNGIWRSDTSCREWVQVFRPNKRCCVYALSIDPQGTVYAGTGQGMWRSEDGRSGWSLVNTSLDASGTRSMAFDTNGRVLLGTFDSVVCRSTDRGVHWRRLGLGQGLGEINALAVTRAGTILAATGYRGLYRSGDDGRTWRKLDVPGDPNVIIEKIAIEARRRIYAGGPGILLQSADDGKHWTRIGRELSDIDGTGLAITASGTVVTGTGDGIAWSVNGGNDWRRSRLRESRPFERPQPPALRTCTTDGQDRVHAVSGQGLIFTRDLAEAE